MARKDRKVQVLVSVDDQHLPKLRQVVERCKAAGLEVEQTLEKIGTLMGSIHPDRIADLAKVAGISSVERSGGYEIAPPDSEVQ